MPRLNKEEQEILDAYEGGKLKSVVNVIEELQRYQDIAAETNRKEEKEILKAFERDQLVPSRNQMEILKEHREAAIAMLKKELPFPSRRDN